MKDYKRLTKKSGWHKDIDLTQELGYSYIYQRLSEVENKIENGALVELPCKIGDTVFRIYKDCSKCKFYKEDGYHYDFLCTFHEDTKNMYEVDGDKDCIYAIEEYRFKPKLTLYENEYLTKAEAGKRLKELKDE